jgi:hypothetical protein
MVDIKINLPCLFAFFQLIHFCEFIIVIYLCNNEIFQFHTYGNFNASKCLSDYNWLTSTHLIELLRSPIEFILHHLFRVYVFIFITIICCAIAFPRSGPGQTFSSVFQVLREDVSACNKEIWISIKDGLKIIFASMNVVKFLELLVIGTFILCVPEIVNFLSKS